MPFIFGQLVIGPPGSGKSTYCKKMSEHLGKLGRKVIVVNIDPANDTLPYECKVDVSELITVEDAMIHKQLGPNGGLLYSIEYLEKNFNWFLGKLNSFKNHYFIFDCPGQVELYSHHNSMKGIMQKLQAVGFSLCAVCLVDSHYCSDPGKFISALLLTLSTMLQMELPHVNVLSKIDLMASFSNKLPFGLDYYTEVLDLNYILEYLQSDKLTAKYKKFNSAIIGMIENYSLISFVPLNVEDTKTLIKVHQAVDKANGYIYAAGEERSVHTLLACAVGAQTDQEWLGESQDKYGAQMM
uniref:GPN-loop GTPase 2 n=1 Tax=Triatoma dimidiata TaxID=72491 RepID=A0A0V0G835_TRIDM